MLYVSSIFSFFNCLNMGAYSVSKRGLEAFADCLRVEMASFGVKVRTDPFWLRNLRNWHMYWPKWTFCIIINKQIKIFITNRPNFKIRCSTNCWKGSTQNYISALNNSWLVIFDKTYYIFKGLVHLKMKILSVFTHPHVVPTP